VTPPRLLTAVLLAGLGCLLAVGVAWRPAGVVARPPAADRTEPLTVLAAWDRSRADAWRLGDPAALGRLYAQGSATGEADRALLTAYTERGLRVTGLQMQREAVEVVSASAERIVLVVTDRVVGAAAVGPRGRIDLPRDDWSRRTVVLRASRDQWRVVVVRDVSAALSPAPT